MSKMPKYLEKNDKNQWWDGVTWRNLGTSNSKTSVHTYYRMQAYRIDDKLHNTNRDGCFKCPRCYLKHYLPTNYDYLCDFCMELVLTHPKTRQETVQAIQYWKQLAKKIVFKQGGVEDYGSEEMQARFEERDALVASRGTVDTDTNMVSEPDLIQMIDSVMNFWIVGDEFD